MQLTASLCRRVRRCHRGHRPTGMPPRICLWGRLWSCAGHRYNAGLSFGIKYMKNIIMRRFHRRCIQHIRHPSNSKHNIFTLIPFLMSLLFPAQQYQNKLNKKCFLIIRFFLSINIGYYHISGEEDRESAHPLTYEPK